MTFLFHEYEPMTFEANKISLKFKKAMRRAILRHIHEHPAGQIECLACQSVSVVLAALVLKIFVSVEERK